MKVNCCDICYNEKYAQKVVRSKYKISIKNATSRFSLDVCEEHKDWIKNFPKTATLRDIETAFLQLSMREAKVEVPQ